MKTTNALAALIVVLLIALIGAVLNVAPVAAQVDVEKVESVAAPERAQVPRYQISAFGTNGLRSYYVIDTITGEIWYSVNGNAPQKQAQIKR